MGTPTSQIVLPFAQRTPRYDREHFIVSQSNEAAWRAGKQWLASKEYALIIAGPACSGKTHLAHVLAHAQLGAGDGDDYTQSPIVLFDDLPVDDPRELLMMLAEVDQSDQRAILTGEGRPRSWACGLPDLETRLEAMPRASLEEPDEALLRAVMTKMFSDRQLAVDKKIIDYTAQRISRTFAAVDAFVAAADDLMLKEKKNLTKPLVRLVLDNLSEGSVIA
ncbi:MAG: hypothetical protein HKN14_14105 [Marinicaulis sp.]|nr:hypothetical protein [Marinicaulis sp.]NNE42040.1 hypothetical protein [Marinicaulis sp.]NNL89497.1 hypothetical protein [Marinicaulis sp.]